jgi:23S rRNA pseudouridine2457 synthase
VPPRKLYSARDATPAAPEKRGVPKRIAPPQRGAPLRNTSAPRNASATRTKQFERSPAPKRPPPAETLLIAFNKPYGVLCQFTADGSRPTLASFIRVPDVYPAGRLDTDSEGLLLLTNHGSVQNAIAHPTRKIAKTYWAQVEGEPDDAAIARLMAPLNLGDFVTAACEARRIAEPPNLWPRDPPVRFRAAIPTSWLEVTITEGKNRQVRRMTAAVGYPTLRLIRAAIGPYQLGKLTPGKWDYADAAKTQTRRT